MPIGASLYDPQGAAVVPKVMEKAKALNKQIHLPIDFLAADKFDKDSPVNRAGELAKKLFGLNALGEPADAVKKDRVTLAGGGFEAPGSAYYTGSSEKGEPPPRLHEHSQQQNKRAEAHEIEQHFDLGVPCPINENTKPGRGQQGNRMERREKFAEDKKQEQQQNDRKVDREALGANEKFVFRHSRPIDERKKERINRHPVAVLGHGVVALIHVPRVAEVCVLVAECCRRRLFVATAVRLNAVDRENHEHDERDRAPSHRSSGLFAYGVSHPRRIRLTAIAASSNEINFETPFIPCLPIQRVKWLA